MAAPPVTTPAASEPTSRDLASRGFAAILVAIVAVVVGRGVAGALFEIPASFQPLSWSELVGVATLAGVGASVAFGLLVRVTQRPERSFLALVGAVLVLSFVPLALLGPTLPGATTELLVVVAAMHVAVAVGVSLPLLRIPGPRTEVEPRSTAR